MRRVEWVFGVEYGEDVKRVRAVLQRIINADGRILDTPAPLIVLGSLSASSVDITVRVWVKVLIIGVFCMISMKLFIRHLMKKASVPFPTTHCTSGKD